MKYWGSTFGLPCLCTVRSAQIRIELHSQKNKSCTQVFFNVGLCWPQRHFDRPQLFYLNTEMVVEQGFSVFWFWL